MTDILLRDVDDALDKALRIQAIEHGRTREAEIKSILETAVVSRRPQKRSISEALMSIPKLDGDPEALFKRSESQTRSIDLD